MEWVDFLENTVAAFAFVLGALFGSFANVVIYRVPRGLSVVRPGSACPGCGTPIRWYQNIPILSYLALRGRCATCKAPISIRYPLVELVCAVLALAVWQQALLNPAAFELADKLVLFTFHFFFMLGLVIIIFVDLDTMMIPDVISLPGTALGLLAALLLGDFTGVTWRDSLAGAGLGAGVIWFIRFFYRRFKGVEGMGLGDVKLMAMLGAFLGWKAVLFILLAGSVQGMLYAVIIYLVGRGGDKQTPPVPQHPDTPAPQVPLEAEVLPGTDPLTACAAGNGKQPAPLDPEDAALAALAAQHPFRMMVIPFGPFLSLAGIQWFFFAGPIEAFLQALFTL
jgi:leader peptidase (prepilin peptidase)/N-methyltransferase